MKKTAASKKQKMLPKKEFQEQSTPIRPKEKHKPSVPEKALHAKSQKLYESDMPPQNENELICKNCKQIITSEKFVDKKLENLPRPFNDKFYVVDESENVFMDQNQRDETFGDYKLGFVKNIYCSGCRKRIGMMIMKTANQGLRKVVQRKVFSKSRLHTRLQKDKVENIKKAQEEKKKEKQRRKESSMEEEEKRSRSSPAKVEVVHMTDKSIQMSNKKEEVKKMRERGVGSSVIAQSESAQFEYRNVTPPRKSAKRYKSIHEESKISRISKAMQAEPPKRVAKKKEDMDEYQPQESYLALTPGRLREKVANLSMQLENEEFESREREEIAWNAAYDWILEIQEAVEYMRNRVQSQREALRRAKPFESPPVTKLANGKRTMGVDHSRSKSPDILTEQRDGMVILSFPQLEHSAGSAPRYKNS